MAKVDTSGVIIKFKMLQAGANADKIAYEQTDPFQRKQGFRLRAVEAFFDPTDVYDISADASILLQIFATNSAVPTAEYSVDSDSVIAQRGIAVPLNTNGMSVVECGWTWFPPDDKPIDIGVWCFGAILATSGMTSAIQAIVKLYGDVVTLTTDEINASKSLFN